MHRVFPLVGVLLIVAASHLQPAAAGTDRHAQVDLTFPVAGPVTFTDTYDANRDDGARRHQATDIFGAKGLPVHAATSGRVCFAPGIDGPMPAYGYLLHICSGNVVYAYIHLNNDTPGTDDGRGGPAAAYAPGIREGVDVRRGQLIGYLGDSGNAEDTPPHLHFSIFDRDLEDPAIASPPWRRHYLNPYPSLRAAVARGDVPTLGGSPAGSSSLLRLGSTGPRVATWQGQLNTVLGTDLAEDGAFGPATDAATRRFQRDRGLADDGVVGPATTAAMTSVLGSTPSGSDSGAASVSAQTGTATFPGRLLRLEAPLMRGDDVRDWQARMRQRGWRGADGAPLAVDGIFGRDSDRAARLFQQEKGLRPVDGVVGPATWAATFASG